MKFFSSTTHPILLSAILAVSLGPAPAVRAAPNLVLVEDGVSRAPIVVFEDAPPMTRQAVDDLAMYIEKIGGARPEIVYGAPDPLPEHAVWIGVQPELAQLFPKIDVTFKHPEEIVIAANADHVVIAGRDVWNPDFLMRKRPHGKPVGVQQEYGTCNAIYTFLRDVLEVRWLWPGELGEDVIEQKTIAVAPMEYRYHPEIRYRAGMFNTMSRMHRLGRNHEWGRYQRLVLGSLESGGGHGFGSWWDRYHETHPEYFALQPDGTRSGFPKPGNAKICHANPAVWTQCLAEIETALEEDPTKTLFNLSPNDGYHAGHCVCERCRAWDHPDGELLWFHWEGLSQEYVSLSERHVIFANTVARMLKERYPDKDYYIGMLAYGNWRPAPVEAVPDDNVIIINVANMFWGLDSGTRDGIRPAEQYANWAKLTRNQIWRPNTGDPAGWQKALPDVPLHRFEKVLKYVAEHGCIGVFVDLVWDHWATQGPLYYLMAQLAWDPSVDGDDVLDEYYRRGFGPAAKELKAYWTMMEGARNRKVDEYPGEGNGFAEVYNAAFFAKARGLLDRAAAKTADVPGKYAERVAFVRIGLDYTEILTEVRALMNRWRASDGADQEAADQVRALWVRIEELCNRVPYAISWKRVVPGSRQMRRGGGMHPDH